MKLMPEYNEKLRYVTLC